MSFLTLLRRTFTIKLQEFCRHCTLHGVYYLFGTHWWVHGLWLLIISCSLSLCCYLSHMIWMKFDDDPTLTVVETTHYSTADIPFPAVTVCDSDHVYGPNTDNISHLLSLRGYNNTQISEFFQSFSEIQLKEYTVKSYVKKMHFLLEDLGYPLKALLFMFKKPCEELVIECSWRSRLHNCSQMFRPVYTMMGHCCQFDITYFKSHVDIETNFVSGVLQTEALEMIVDGQRISADGGYSTGYALMYACDEREKISFVNSAVTLTPAFFDVNVYLWTIDSSTYVKALDLNKRRCILDTDSGATSFEGCMSRTIMRKVVEQCKCLPFELTAEELSVQIYTICTWDRLACIYQNLEKVQADVRLVMSQTECFQKCDYVQYSIEVELMNKQRILSGFSNSRSSVSVHFSDTTCMKYRREVLYTWDQMLANLGGIFGLCLGGSIISVIEILWFILDLIFSVIGDMFAQRKNSRKKAFTNKINTNKVYTLNENDLNRTLENKIFNVRYKFTN